MKTMQPHTLLRASLIGLAASCAASVHADEPSHWGVRAGVTHIMPQVRSGDLSAPSFSGTRVDIDAATQVTGGLTYFINDKLSIDLPLSAPFQFDVYGDGAILGVGKLGDSKSLPATALLQYRFGEAGQKWRPYVGGGATYAYFYDQRSTAALSALTGGGPGNPTSLKVRSKLGATLQVGVNLDLGERWYFDIAMLKTYLTTDGKLSTGQTIDLKLNPLTVTMGVGRRF